MAGAKIVVTGIEETQQLLADAPKNVVMLGYGRASNAAMNVLAEALISRTPVKHGDLARALVINVSVDANSKGSFGQVGFGKQGLVAYWLEYGHRIVTHKPGKKEVGEVSAQPFMRPAFDSSADAAIDAFCAALEASLKQAY